MWVPKVSPSHSSATNAPVCATPGTLVNNWVTYNTSNGGGVHIFLRIGFTTLAGVCKQLAP
jgi:hypothetical protein